MKRKFLKTIVLAVLVAVGGRVSAQLEKGYTVEPLADDIAQKAQQVLDLNLENPDKAFTVFNQILRKAKKNSKTLISIGDYFLENRIYPCANMCAKQVYENDPQNLEGLFFSGQVAMLRKDYGGAGQKYDEILSYDPDNVLAMRWNAFVYKNVNPTVAVEMLTKIKELLPEEYNADKELGDIYYKQDDFKKAATHYKAYFEKVPEADMSEAAAENFVSSLHLNRDIESLGTYAVKFGEKYPKSAVFKRMKFFADYENYDLDAAKESVKYLTEGQFPDSAYTYLDYEYVANYADAVSDLPGAIGYMQKGLAKDSTKVNGYKQLAQFYRSNREYEKSIDVFKTYLAKRGTAAELTDTFRLGEYYLYASQADDVTPERKAELVKEGDAIFAMVEARTPENYQATFYRARINITEHPTEKVRALYEEVLKKTEDNYTVDAVRVEANTYNLVYYIQNDELPDALANARKYCDAILEIAPDNPMAQNADRYLKSQGF